MCITLIIVECTLNLLSALELWPADACEHHSRVYNRSNECGVSCVVQGTCRELQLHAVDGRACTGAQGQVTRWGASEANVQVVTRGEYDYSHVCACPLSTQIGFCKGGRYARVGWFDIMAAVVRVGLVSLFRDRHRCQHSGSGILVWAWCLAYGCKKDFTHHYCVDILDIASDSHLQNQLSTKLQCSQFAAHTFMHPSMAAVA